MDGELPPEWEPISDRSARLRVDGWFAVVTFEADIHWSYVEIHPGRTRLEPLAYLEIDGDLALGQRAAEALVRVLGVR